MTAFAEARSKLSRWRAHPIAMVREEFGVEPDPGQAEVLRVFPSQDERDLRIALQGCGGNGKSAVMAWCGLNFMACYGEAGLHPKGLVISITKENLRDNLWAEYALWRGRSAFFTAAFGLTHEHLFLREHPETWFLSFRAFPKDSNAETKGKTLSGTRAPFVLIQIDESAAIPIQVAKAADQPAATARWFKVMQSGNPITQLGMLYAAATNLRHLWHVIRIHADPDKPEEATPRVNRAWARQMVDTYGREDPWVMAYILSEFPKSAINTLLTADEVDVALKRNPKEHEFNWAPKTLSADVARGGLARSVISPKQGCLLYRFKKLPSSVDGIEGAGHFARAYHDWKADAGFVDGTGGFGGSWIDQLKVLKIPVTPIMYSGGAPDPRYLNMRAYMWFKFARWVKDVGALPNDPNLIRALTTVTYTHSGDRLKLEDKDFFSVRLGFSPDEGDAAAGHFAYPVGSRRLVEEVLGGRRAFPLPDDDYDPHAWAEN